MRILNKEEIIFLNKNIGSLALTTFKKLSKLSNPC